MNCHLSEANWLRCRPLADHTSSEAMIRLRNRFGIMVLSGRCVEEGHEKLRVGGFAGKYTMKKAAQPACQWLKNGWQAGSPETTGAGNQLLPSPDLPGTCDLTARRQVVTCRSPGAKAWLVVRGQRSGIAMCTCLPLAQVRFDPEEDSIHV